jgi:Cu+-exporting ATPase
MRQNLFWAVAYNLVMVPIAMLTPLPPALATAAMMCSSLTVVCNALRLRRA